MDIKRILWILLVCCCGMTAVGQTYRVGDLYTAPDGSQGIVYYLHPDGSGGWVVALHDLPNDSQNPYVAWGEYFNVPGLPNQQYSYYQYANLLYDTAGYANTLAMRAYLGTSSDYSAGIVDFENGWVLPSPAQMMKLISQRSFISDALVSAGGEVLGTNSYWTSAEYSSTEAWCVNGGHGGFDVMNKNISSMGVVRAVRSFTYEPTYVWNTGDTTTSITVAPEGTSTYRVSVSLDSSCSGVAEQIVEVNPIDTTPVVITACENYTWHGITYDTSGVHQEHYLNRNGCDSVVILYLTVNNPIHQSITATGIESYEWHDSVYTQDGDYLFSHLDENGCTQVDTLHLTIYHGTTTQFDTTVCESDLPMEWGGVIFAEAGTHVDSLETFEGADSLVFWNVHVVELPVLAHSPDTAVLAGDSLTLWAAGSEILTWTDSDGNPVGGGATISVRPLTSGYYFVTGYSSGAIVGEDSSILQCPATDSIWVEVLPNPDTMLLTDSACVYYVWYGDTLTQSAVYYHTMTNQLGYDSVEVLTLTVHTSDTVEFSQLAMGAYTWNGQTYTEAGDYTITLENQYGCDSVVTMHLVFVQLPDNVDYAECVADNLGHDWGIMVDWSSSTMVSPLVIPLVGDINGDEVPEIICFAPYSFYSVNQVLVFNTTNHQVMHSITLPGSVSTVDAAPFGIVKLPNGHVIYVVVMESQVMQAYDLTAMSTTPLWSTNVSYGAPNVGFIDFNADSYPEIYIGKYIYDAETGTLLAYAPNTTNDGSAIAHNDNVKLVSSFAQNVVGDARPDLILGNEIYEVSITNRNGQSGNSVTLAASITPPQGIVVDGHPQVADFNLDGHLDVFISNKDSRYANVGFYVWDVFNGTVSSPVIISNSTRGKSIPLIADIDNDDLLEVVIQCNSSGNKVKTYKFHPETNSFSFIWDVYVNEDSYSNSMSIFDLNNDGISDLLISDQTTVRIMNGSGRSHLTGNDTLPVYGLTSLSFGECTVMQYPIVADVDADGSAELLVLGLFGAGHTYRAYLNVFKSAGAPWAPARKVWNQYMYDVTNINEDLSVPQYPFDNATVFTDPEGIVRRPYNNFLQQATTIDPYGRPFYAVPDVAVNGIDLQRDGNNASVTVSYCNVGDNVLATPYSLTVFANAYGGDTIHTFTVGENLWTDSCTQYTVQIPAAMLCQYTQLDSLVLAVNCNGNGIAQNGGLQPECDTTNNVATIAFSLIADTTIVSVSVCDSLRWIDGNLYTESTDTPTFTLTNAAGCDSVVTLHLRVIDTAVRIVSLTPDFCEDLSAELMVVTDMPNYVWSTGETAPTITVTHSGRYYVTATSGDCSSTAHFTVENCDGNQLLLPNAITPSRGDGLNDYFSIPERNLLNINLFEIWIYNRWGELVYYSNDKNFRWNGEYRGQTQYQTVYNYVIRYTDAAGKPYFVKGSVTVL